MRIYRRIQLLVFAGTLSSVLSFSHVLFCFFLLQLCMLLATPKSDFRASQITIPLALSMPTAPFLLDFGMIRRLLLLFLPLHESSMVQYFSCVSFFLASWLTVV
jgi:hypothetical protein